MFLFLLEVFLIISKFVSDRGFVEKRIYFQLSVNQIVLHVFAKQMISFFFHDLTQMSRPLSPKTDSHHNWSKIMLNWWNHIFIIQLVSRTLYPYLKSSFHVQLLHGTDSQEYASPIPIIWRCSRLGSNIVFLIYTHNLCLFLCNHLPRVTLGQCTVRTLL